MHQTSSQLKIPIRPRFITVLKTCAESFVLSIVLSVQKLFMHTNGVFLSEQPTVPNDFGTFNNVISVNTTDFEVFEALGKDCLETGHSDDPNCRTYGMCNVLIHQMPTGLNIRNPNVIQAD